MRKTLQQPVQTSILDHIFLDDINVVENLSVEKQPVSNHSLVYLTSTGDKRETTL